MNLKEFLEQIMPAVAITATTTISLNDDGVPSLSFYGEDPQIHEDLLSKISSHLDNSEKLKVKFRDYSYAEQSAESVLLMMSISEEEIDILRCDKNQALMFVRCNWEIVQSTNTVAINEYVDPRCVHETYAPDEYMPDESDASDMDFIDD